VFQPLQVFFYTFFDILIIGLTDTNQADFHTYKGVKNRSEREELVLTPCFGILST
jgi:hypothetical protein